MSRNYITVCHLEGQMFFTRIYGKKFSLCDAWNFSKQYIHQFPIRLTLIKIRCYAFKHLKLLDSFKFQICME